MSADEAEQLDTGGLLTAVQWRAALLATELAFISNVIGSGLDWGSTTGVADHLALDLLRGLQRKLGPVIA